MKIKNLFLAALAILALTSCDKNTDNNVDPNPNPSENGSFIVTVTPVAATAVADYLLTTDNLDEGTISTKGKGIEQDGTYRYYVTHNNKFFSMLYGQGNPGAVTVYDIQNGALNKVANSVTETVQAFAPVDEDILMMKISRDITNPTTSWYKFNTNSLTITEQGNFNTVDILKNGELAHFSWIKQVGNKVFAPIFSIKACCKAGFGTAFPDQAWIAVFSYPDMKLEKVFSDNRTSYIGRYFVDGMGLTENGDLYTFSPSIASTGGEKDEFNSTKPSAITRVKSGTTEFDQSFYIDFEEISGGMIITDWLYVGDNKFVVLSTPKTSKELYTAGKVIGILDVAAKSYKKVSGGPDVKDIKLLTGNNFTKKDGTGYIGVNLTSGIGYVYKIDANTATATQGLKVEGGTITAIQHLD